MRQSSGKRGAGQPEAGKEDNTNESGRSAYVVYQTTKKEITALVLDSSGNLYVAAIGEKRPGAPSPPVPQSEQNAPNAARSVTGLRLEDRVSSSNRSSPHRLPPFRHSLPPLYTASLPTVRLRRFGPLAKIRSTPWAFLPRASFCSVPAIRAP